MPLFVDRVMETSVTTGTGTLTLAGAVTGFRTFSSKHLIGELVSYAVEDVDGSGNPAGAWEIGIGRLATPATLQRLHALEGSNANALVNFTGNLRVWSNQPSFLAYDEFATGQYAAWFPGGGSTVVPGVFGQAAFSTVGAATIRNPATTNRLTRSRRAAYVSATTAAALAGVSVQAAGAKSLTIGDGSAGGFVSRIRFGASDAAAVAGARMFVGLREIVTAPANVEPSTLINVIGVGQISTSTNLHFLKGGTTAQAVVDLGANFPAAGLSSDLYEMTIIAPRNVANVVLYNLERIGTGFVSSGLLPNATPGTTLPANTLLLAPALWRTNNATLLAVGIDIASVINYSDY